MSLYEGSVKKPIMTVIVLCQRGYLMYLFPYKAAY